jgi:hypothetical protein
MRGISGKLAKMLVGYTGAFTLTLAMGTPYATAISVSIGFVIGGNAGGMYKMCLDKQTLYSIFGHINPAWQHLVWYPRAAEGDLSLLAGIPISSAFMHDDDSGLVVPMAALNLDYFPSFACAALREPCCGEGVPAEPVNLAEQEMPASQAQPSAKEPQLTSTASAPASAVPTLQSLEDCCESQGPMT